MENRKFFIKVALEFFLCTYILCIGFTIDEYVIGGRIYLLKMLVENIRLALCMCAISGLLAFLSL